ncbi:MAG: SH3 domain-containing protein, partial [Crocosphaera sp.]
MKLKNSLLAVTMMITSLGVTFAVKADTVNARCDVYPKGEDRATSSGLCTFSQRQGVVGIQLENGERYDLRPVGDRPGNYKDDN